MMEQEEPKTRVTPKRKSKVVNANAGSEHIYIVTSPEMRQAGKFKVGFHTGDRDKLLHRYITALNQVELVMFIRGTLAEERTVHDRLSPYRVPNHNGKASEWYSMPERALITKVMEILNTTSPETSTPVIQVPEIQVSEIQVSEIQMPEIQAPETQALEVRVPDKYFGPVKFLQACESGRWDLIREWLGSKEYKQDKHIRSKQQRRTEKEFQAEAIRWNEAHQWVVCLERMCACAETPISVVELLLGYCDRRWTRAGAWIEPSEAREAGYAIAKKVENTAVLTYLQTWGAGETKIVPVPKVGAGSDLTSLIEVRLLAETKEIAQCELLTDPRDDETLTRIITLETGKTASFAIARAVCTVLHRGNGLNVLRQIMDRDSWVVVSSTVYAAEAQCRTVLSKFIDMRITVGQMVSAAITMNNKAALDFLVMSMGATWSIAAREAAVLWAEKGDRGMVEHIKNQGVPINWDHAFVVGVMWKRLDMLKYFVSLGVKRIDVALDLALKEGAPAEIIDYLCNIISIP